MWIGEPTNLFAVFQVRISVCLFFKRLVPPENVYIWTLWGFIAALTISVYIFFNAGHSARSGSLRFQEAALIMPSRPLLSGSAKRVCCPDGLNYTLLTTELIEAVSISADIILLCIPICLFWRLQVNMRTELALIFMFPGSFVSRLDPQSTQWRLKSGT